MVMILTYNNYDPHSLYYTDLVFVTSFAMASVLHDRLLSSHESLRPYQLSNSLQL